MLKANSPLQNRLLAELPAADYRRLLRFLQPVEWESGAVLAETGAGPMHVYFPTSSVVSLRCSDDEDAGAHLALVGNEGAVGTSLVLGQSAIARRAVVLVGGSAYRLSARVLKAEIGRGGALLQLLLNFAQALVAQMAQTALCNHRHSAQQQLCRGLLLNLDRLSPDAPVADKPQGYTMPGLRRHGMTEAVLSLWAAGSIQVRRGSITVLDRLKLEQRVCGCYAMVKRESDRPASHHLAAAQPAA